MQGSGVRELGGGSEGAQAIPARYFNITDANAWPVAGLLVFMDSQGQPVRAELHLYDELPSHVHEGAVKQCRAVLQESFASPEPLPLRIMQISQMRDAMDVRLPAERIRPVKRSRRPQIPMTAALGVIAVLLALSVAAWALSGNDSDEQTDEPATGAIAPTVAMQMVAGLTQSATEADAPAAAVDLPPSRNANPQIGVGMRVAIVPGLRLTLRSEPGADAGNPIGYMMDGDEAIVIGGPTMTQGTSDTIVWWLVQLVDGTEAWAAANTSNETLLTPAE
ncbi:MAG: SH3 domain-containing protein [Chloroflexota bacterium]|nr:SH3 domain-containing protein [Chloroflexota bacterium]